MTSRWTITAQPAWSHGSYFTDPDRDEPKRITPAQVRREQATSYVLFIECDGLVKISTTTDDPRRRVWSLRSVTGEKRLAAVMPNAGEVRKRELQEMFAAHRLGGDWFEHCPELDALISAFAIFAN